ncbi:GNAT family N-acetyltransferase [Anaerobacillus sp. CMMVII]|uniref:GNAT family N-acetyltransferase n=1 Tax=Anaerobacillus sp. CMMVII TaxID=2755588 RepID=UPI0021B714E6|nr:GNAT family N-acetyltransferase [Anaerobacillus sp. CMMVII]MCT8136838.1 GNAT family N-acetyltransferase [Anaerobacillus sp. CMMVII]
MQIRRPSLEDVEVLHQFFRLVITDTFAKEGLGHLLDDIEKEIESKRKLVSTDLESNGKDRYFLVAVMNDQLLGTIEFGAASNLIIECTNGELQGLNEVGTVFVHPNYQRQGIGTLLLNAMFLTLQNIGTEEFCLDSGYKTAQKIWQKKFGDPEYILKDYWGVGNDHLIWRRRLSQLLK